MDACFDTDPRGLITSPDYFAVIKVGADSATGDVAREEELEAQGDLPDERSSTAMRLDGSPNLPATWKSADRFGPAR